MKFDLMYEDIVCFLSLSQQHSLLLYFCIPPLLHSAGNETLKALINDLDVVKEKRVFDFMKRKKDWFEARYAEMDVVLEDFIAMIHPEVHVDHERVWWRNV